MLNWYLQSGKDSDVVISSRIRLARNIAEFPFESKCSKEVLKKIEEKIENIVPNIGYGLKFLKLQDMDDLTKMSLVEKHLISPEFVSDPNENRAILLNNEENICIMINEEDHMRIQVFAAGMELETLLGLAVEIDEKMQDILHYAYSEKYGFLTNCPTDSGTAMRASVMVHLPALTETGNIGKILEIINNFGMNIRGIYGEGSKTLGNMYQISNKQSLGISEKEIINNLKLITDKIIEQERLARKYLGKKEVELEDNLYRAYGTLNYCRKISFEECKQLLSKIKLGTDLGILKEMTDAKVNKLELYTKPANLQKYYGKSMDSYERDLKRAVLIQQIMKE